MKPPPPNTVTSSSAILEPSMRRLSGSLGARPHCPLGMFVDKRATPLSAPPTDS
jgi:hypothetical protein